MLISDFALTLAFCYICNMVYYLDILLLSPASLLTLILLFSWTLCKLTTLYPFFVQNHFYLPICFILKTHPQKGFLNLLPVSTIFTLGKNEFIKLPLAATSWLQGIKKYLLK